MGNRLERSYDRVTSTLSRGKLRVLFVVIILLSMSSLASAATGGISTASKEAVPEAPPTTNHTVVTESGRAGTITAYNPNGEVIYYNNTRTKYFDVDPLEGSPQTIEYAATDTIHTKGPTCSEPPCTLNVIERANLSTGEVEVIYARYDAKELAAEWHDADRINDSRVLVADMVSDQVFIINTETEIIEWAWDAQSDFPVEGGGDYPRDWAHINDVEYIGSGEMEGWIMVSLRNQDQVVFIDRQQGLLENWTLGSDGNHSIQYEQHNPDYIPQSEGGPAIVVADSENGRVQEFQRENGEWTRTWQWEDDRIQWPRDADRLPNGNTLITDTHGNRVIEVNQSGAIVWQVESTLPYEAERLETGDESTNGQSARELNLESRTVSESEHSDEEEGISIGLLRFIGGFIEWVLPHWAYNGLLFLAPVWIGATEVAALGVALLTAVVWVAVEARWRLRDAGVQFQTPISL